MTEKGWIIVVMWLAYSAGTVALTLKDPDNGMALGIIGAITLAIATVSLFRKD